MPTTTEKTEKPALPRHDFVIPEPLSRFEVGGRQVVVIPTDIWEEVVELLEDYIDVRDSEAALADPKDLAISLEEARSIYLDNHIKKVRRRKKMTQKELAKKLSISQTRVSQIENTDYRPTIKTYRRVAKALGVDITELI